MHHQEVPYHLKVRHSASQDNETSGSTKGASGLITFCIRIRDKSVNKEQLFNKRKENRADFFPRNYSKCCITDATQCVILSLVKF